MTRAATALLVAWAAVVLTACSATSPSKADRAPSRPAAAQEARVSITGTKVIRYAIRSRYVRARLAQTAVIPPHAGRWRPLLVFLHGRGGYGNEANANHAFYAGLARLGRRAPVVIFPNGGDHGYWHDRRSGRWAQYLLHEVIPQAVRRLHADPRRVALGGISMGGFGAYDLALRYPGRFCGVGGTSPALRLGFSPSIAFAFDDQADFARHDVISTARAGRTFGSTAAWFDAGSSDTFVAGDRMFLEALRAHGVPINARFSPGGHDARYWRSHYAESLAFYSRALAHCRR